MIQHAQANDEDSGGTLAWTTCQARYILKLSFPIDEYDHISTRSLALARYKRNHELMNEVFMHAAFGRFNVSYQFPSAHQILPLGEKNPKDTLKTYACFDGAELKEKTVRSIFRYLGRF